MNLNLFIALQMVMAEWADMRDENVTEIEQFAGNLY